LEGEVSQNRILCFPLQTCFPTLTKEKNSILDNFFKKKYLFLKYILKKKKNCLGILKKFQNLSLAANDYDAFCDKMESCCCVWVVLSLFLTTAVIFIKNFAGKDLGDAVEKVVFRTSTNMLPVPNGKIFEFISEAKKFGVLKSIGWKQNSGDFFELANYNSEGSHS